MLDVDLTWTPDKWKSICEILQDFNTYAICIFTVFLDAFDISRRSIPRNGTLFAPPSSLHGTALSSLYVNVSVLNNWSFACLFLNKSYLFLTSIRHAHFLSFSWNFVIYSECSKSQQVARVSDLLERHNVKRWRHLDVFKIMAMPHFCFTSEVITT